MSQPRTKFFSVHRDAEGQWTSGHADSYYRKTISATEPSFVVGNGAFVVAMSPDGSLGQTCVFTGETVRNGEKRKMPGGWVTWKREIAYGSQIRLEVAGKTINPAADWPVSTSFLGNAIPVARYSSAQLSLEVVACPPISFDGTQRPRGMVWGALIRNTSAATIEGSLDFMPAKGLTISGSNLKTPFKLDPGAQAWFPAVLTVSDDASAAKGFAAHGALEWLVETSRYWQRVLGTFSMPDDPFTAELFTRLNVKALQAGEFNEHGQPIGVSFGLFPFIDYADNFRDSYYAILPATQRDPVYLRAFIAWFHQYSTPPVDENHPRGVLHSLGNTLNACNLAGLYDQATGDKAFFVNGPELVEGLCDTLEKVLATRQPGQPDLFGSGYISDGYSLGDYHTGSNVCAWRAFSSVAQILQETGRDPARAARYQEIANHIKTDLDRRNILPKGPFGPQYVEGTDADGSVPVMVHDGEESDTTLMPFYGYCRADFPPYLNWKRFAVSTHNVAFNPETRGVVWESYGPNAKRRPVGGYEADSTFPSFISGLASNATPAALRGPDSYLHEIRRLTDVDGTFWFWPYGKDARHGENLVRKPFESGWAEGVFVNLFQVNYLGLNYHAAQSTLAFRPNPGIGNFEWKDFPMGLEHFTVASKDGALTVTNLTARSVNVILGDEPAMAVPPGESVSRTLRPPLQR